MLRRSLPAILLISALSVCAAEPTPRNLDFESGAPGEAPPGWTLPAATSGYAATISTDKPKQGKQCARISGAPQASESGARVVGHLTQEIDATPYRGKRVRLRGAVRVEGETAVSVLTMRVERPAKQVGFSDSMTDRPIRSAEWAYYEITGDVAPDAVLLTVGMMLRQTGSAWLDDVSIEILGKSELRSGPPREVTPRGMENLIAFTRLYGLVRHFHPSDEVAAADWNAVAVNGIDVVESAKNPVELAVRLGEVFLPLAPSLRIFPTDATPGPLASRPDGAQTVVAWEHYGWGSGRVPYVSKRVRHDVDQGPPPETLVTHLGGSVSAAIPLAVYADASRTLPRPARKPLPQSTATYTGNDRATRIGVVVIAWNILQHFYPYFDVVDVDWHAELRTALRAAGTDPDEAAFARTLRRMIAAIDDGHGAVQHPSLMGRAPLPLLWRVAGDTLVVTNVAAGVSGVSVGDEVVAIDGKPALQLLAEEEALVSAATPGWRRVTAVNALATGLAGTEAALTLRGADGATRTVKLTRAVRTEPLLEKRPERIVELKPGLWYVDLTRIQDKDFEAALPKLATAKGIVFDVRGYPRLGAKVLQHQIDALAQSPRWNIPIVRQPDRQGLEWDEPEHERWNLQPAQPRLTRNIVYLTDARAISYAESLMGVVEAYKLGEIVGEPTAGTNGNINVIKLPGDYSVVFTGMKTLKHDRSRHHGVGIVPTVPVTPTLAGIRAGRDEQLERALEMLER